LRKLPGGYYNKFLVISKQAMLAAEITFMEELLPYIGICTVMSASDNSG
jgi:hypothetical protein